MNELFYQHNQPKTWLEISGKDQKGAEETCHAKPHQCIQQ